MVPSLITNSLKGKIPFKLSETGTRESLRRSKVGYRNLFKSKRLKGNEAEEEND